MFQSAAMIWKELTQVANRRRFAVQKFLIVAGIATLYLALAWEEIYARDFTSWERAARFGGQFFFASGALMTLLFSVVAMGFAAGIVAEERDKKRLGLLLVTPLSSFTIISAKGAAVFTHVIAGVILSLPLFAFLTFFGGVSSGLVVRMLLYLVANVWLYGCIGLFASVIFKKRSAVGVAFLFAVLWNALPMLVASLQGPGRVAWVAPWVYFYALSPFVTFVSMVEPRAMVPTWVLWIHLGWNFLLGGLFLAMAVYLFRPLATRSLSGGATRRKREKKIKAAKKRSLCGMGLDSVFGAGVLGKELCSWRPAKALLSLAWFSIFYGMMFLGRYTLKEWDDLFTPEAHVVYFGIEAMGFFLLLSMQAAAPIVHERERSTLHSLLLTGISAWRVLFGKAAALLVRNALGLVFLALHAIYILGIRTPDYFNPLWLLPMLILAPVFSIALGLYFSLCSKRSNEAGALTVAAWIFGGVGPYLALRWVTNMEDRVVNAAWFSVFALIAVALISLAVYLWRRRGHGSWLSLMTYVAVALVLLAFAPLVVSGCPNPFTRAGARDYDRVFENGILLGGVASLPAASYAVAFDTGPRQRWRLETGRAALMAMHLGLLCWMLVSLRYGWESLARRV